MRKTVSCKECCIIKTFTLETLNSLIQSAVEIKNNKFNEFLTQRLVILMSSQIDMVMNY